MYLQGMKDMYEWINLMTKDRLSSTTLPAYFITRLNSSQHSSLTEVRSDRIGRSITPRPQSCYYCSPNNTYESGVSLTTPLHFSTPENSRPLSCMSDDKFSILNYSRSSSSPGRDTNSPDAYSPSIKQANSPLLQHKKHFRREQSHTPLYRGRTTTVKDRGVFATLYRPDCTIRNKDIQTSYRHSSYNPVVKTDSVIN